MRHSSSISPNQATNHLTIDSPAALHALALSGQTITGRPLSIAGVAPMHLGEFLQTNPDARITSLNLSNNGEEGVNVLRDLIKIIKKYPQAGSHIETLDLSSNMLSKLDTVQLDKFSAFIDTRLPELQTLNLSSNNLREENINYLATAVLHIPSLRCLDLTGNAGGSLLPDRGAINARFLPAAQVAAAAVLRWGMDRLNSNDGSGR